MTTADPHQAILDFLDARDRAAFAGYDVDTQDADMREAIQVMEKIAGPREPPRRTARRGGAGKAPPVAHYLDRFEVPR